MSPCFETKNAYTHRYLHAHVHRVKIPIWKLEKSKELVYKIQWRTNIPHPKNSSKSLGGTPITSDDKALELTHLPGALCRHAGLHGRVSRQDSALTPLGHNAELLDSAGSSLSSTSWEPHLEGWAG